MRLHRTAAVGTACAALGIGALGVDLAAGHPFPETHQFSAGNAHTHVDQSIVTLNFDSVSKGRRTKKIQAQLFSGFPPPNTAQLAAVGATVRLACDPESTGDLQDGFWIQRGRDGEGPLRVHHNRVSFHGRAFDGRVHEGKLAFKVKFNHKGTIARGSIRVHGAKMENEFGDPLTNCDTEPKGKPANRGKPLRFRMTAFEG